MGDLNAVSYGQTSHLGMLTAERPFLFERLCDATRASQSEEVACGLDDR